MTTPLATTRSVLKFDLSNIPATATVVLATLTLTILETHVEQERTLSVYRALRAWVEDQATWNLYSTGNSWGTAGADAVTDREAVAIGSVTITPTETLNVGKEIILTPALVQGMFDGTITNNGFVLRLGTETSNLIGFASFDHATVSYRPKLTILYSLP